MKVVSTKDRRAAQAPCACKDKQHMQVVECVLLCECFSSAFCKLLQRHYFLPIVLVTERGGVQHCVGVTRWLFCVTHIITGHTVSAGKARAPFWNLAILHFSGNVSASTIEDSVSPLVIPFPILSGAQPQTFAAERDSSENAISHRAETTVPVGKLLPGNGLVEGAGPATPSWKECTGAVGKVAEPADGREFKAAARRDCSMTPVQAILLPGGFVLPVLYYFGLGGGNIICGSSPAILPLFPYPSACRTGVHIVFVWENPMDMSCREHSSPCMCSWW